jgi:hypothetical protein
VANAVLSNRERAKIRKATPRAPRVAKGEAVVKVGRPAVANDPEMDGRDGLLWLGQKRRLTAEQLQAAFRYRDRVRDAEPVSIRCALDGDGAGSDPSTRSPSPVLSLTSAKRELFVIRWQVLRGEADMLTVMDGVCGAGHTLRYLAGGSQRRAADLEAILKVALNLVAAWAKEPSTGA